MTRLLIGLALATGAPRGPALLDAATPPIAEAPRDERLAEEAPARPAPAAATAPDAPSIAPARPIAALLLTAPLHLGATLGATWFASRAVTADGDGSFAAHLTGLRDRDEPAQVLFVGSLVLAAPALSALVPYGLLESQPGMTTSYPAIWAAGAIGQLAGVGLVAASEGTGAVVLSVALVAVAEVGAALFMAGPDAP